MKTKRELAATIFALTLVVFGRPSLASAQGAMLVPSGIGCSSRCSRRGDRTSHYVPRR